MQKIGFDNDKYLTLQTERIKERMEYFGGKLYLEFGGKLFDDFHAARVLPGFLPDSKMRMLVQLKDQAEIIIAINANDIQKNKRRGDLGITYDLEVMRLIDAFREYGLYVGSVVLTRYASQSSAQEPRHSYIPSLCDPGLSVQHPPGGIGRRLRKERLHRDQPPCGGGHGARSRQRQDGHLPEPALS